MTTSQKVEILKECISHMEMPDFCKRLMIHLINGTELLTNGTWVNIEQKWTEVDPYEGVFVDDKNFYHLCKLIRLVNPKFHLSAAVLEKDIVTIVLSYGKVAKTELSGDKLLIDSIKLKPNVNDFLIDLALQN